MPAGQLAYFYHENNRHENTRNAKEDDVL